MRQPDHTPLFSTRMRTVLCASACLLALGSVHAQESSDQNVPAATARQQASEIARGDPARWFREDASAAARLRTLQKEISAGLQEAQGNCRRLPAGERAACNKEARATYQQEMAGARQQVMAER
jgi:hypothetical protein